MSNNSASISKLDKKFISVLLQVLEERKEKNEVDLLLYNTLKEKYSTAFDNARDKSKLLDGFTTLQAIAPSPETIRDSVNQLFQRIQEIDNEKQKIEERFSKLDELLSQANISEKVYESKKREYQLLILRIDEQKQDYLSTIPDSLRLIREINEEILDRIEELDAESKILSKKVDEYEKKRLNELRKDISSAAKKLSEIINIDYEENDQQKALPKTPFVTSAKIAPLKDEIVSKTPQESIVLTSKDEQSKPPVWVKWKNITIGKFVSEINFIFGNYVVIVTDRPSLAILREIALTGPESLRSTSNAKTIEDKLRNFIQDKFRVPKEKALLSEHLIKYAIENKIGVNLFRLINSYYAAVDKKAITKLGNEVIINENEQILTLNEKVNLLGKRVLAPDNNLIGVIHELYFDPATSNIYTFSFKGVPPQIIKKIFQDSHPRNLFDNTFNEFRTEISKELSIPIYEAFTPSSMIRYSLYKGQIKNLNQLVTLVESMNPRISKASDIASISTQGILLSKFPMNTLPKIELLEY